MNYPKEGCRTLATRRVGNFEVDIVGCWDENTQIGNFKFYDLYVGDECINLDDPFYTLPTDEDISAVLAVCA
jgi:hypothetical protein